MASVRGLLNIQSLNELTYENRRSASETGRWDWEVRDQSGEDTPDRARK
jgi:hypothetical protein